jgi:hypothetical protein
VCGDVALIIEKFIGEAKKEDAINKKAHHNDGLRC